METTYNSSNTVFGLDIGTRSLVGTVGYMTTEGRFQILKQVTLEHTSRAMLDGQIHDIATVSRSIKIVKEQLEQALHFPLKEVCIAAAGRVLKTKTVLAEHSFEYETQVTEDIIYSLELSGVEQAYEALRKELRKERFKFYCVGYSVVRYYLNDNYITNLAGHKAIKVGAEVLATFLPEEVIDGLYSAVEGAGLTVVNLTLEPIAAMHVAIPQNIRLLNLALVDVGAGTSDFSITKDGSIIAFGMIPMAGDEMTETLAKKYLVDFNTAELIKRSCLSQSVFTYQDIIGISHQLEHTEILADMQEITDTITTQIADKIKELNGGKSVSAVFVVGGGGKLPTFTNRLADKLEILPERVALRGSEVLGNIDFVNEEVTKDSLLVTPIGICLNYYEQKNNFIYVTVNGEQIKLYDNGKLTVLSAAMVVNINTMDLFPKRGDGLGFSLNGQERQIRGELGEAAIIQVNKKPADMMTKVKSKDIITITPSTIGSKATTHLKDLSEYKGTLRVSFNGKKLHLPLLAEANRELVYGDYLIKPHDQIEILNYYTVRHLLTFMELFEVSEIMVNGTKADLDTRIYDDYVVNTTIVAKQSSEKVLSEESVKLYNEDYIDIKKEIEEPNSDWVEELSSDWVEELSSDWLEEQNANQKNANQIDEISSDKKEDAKTAIAILFNGRPLTLSGKTTYIFVDILDFVPFNLQSGFGKKLKMQINGMPCEFTTQIRPNDQITMEWI